MIEGEEQANEEIHEQQEVLMNENENASLYRLCGGILLKGRAVAKTSKFLPAAFSLTPIQDLFTGSAPSKLIELTRST